MIDSFRQQLASLSDAAPDRRPRRARLGFYGYRYRKARSRTAMLARCTIAAILLIATLAAAIEQMSR
jgi:phosphoenolpyruvate carboxylase